MRIYNDAGKTHHLFLYEDEGECALKDAQTGTGFRRAAILVVLHGVEEDVKQADQVCGAGLVLRVELDTGKTQHLIYKPSAQRNSGILWFVSSLAVT